MTSTAADIKITNGLIVDAGAIKPGDILINDGKVAAVVEPGAGTGAERTIDAAGQYVLPGIVDAHLHPVYVDRMDTLSRAAAREGVTTLIPYVGAVKAWGQEGGLVESLDSFIAEAENTSLVDFSLHCTMMQADMTDAAQTVPILIERGITSFKGFMAYAKRGMKLEDRQLLDLMSIIAEHGGIFAAHAENGDIIDFLEDRFMGLGQESPEYYPSTHPGICEAEAVFRLLSLARTAGCPVYIPHISAAETLDVLALFRQYGAPRFHAETCPHYLCMGDELMGRYGTLAKMAPPLRKEKDREALWRAVAQGVLEVVASDHAAESVEKNQPLSDKVFSAPNGIPGMETLFKTMFHFGVNQGRLGLPGLVRVLSENPARIFGLYPRKGALKPGSDADLVMVDPALPFEIKKRHRELKVEYSLYEGVRGIGAPVLTMQRGETVFSDDEVKGAPGRGRFLAAGPRGA